MGKPSFKRVCWFILPVLIGIIVVSLVIISIYSPSKNKILETAKEICADSTKTEACKEALLSSDIWGVKRWTKIFGDPCLDEASSFQQTSDGGYIIGGNTGNCTPNINGTRSWYPFLLKTDTNGNKVWQERYKGFALSIQQTTDGGYIAAGTINLPIGAPDADLQADVYLLKTDADGNVIWEKNYGEDKTNGIDTLDEGRSVQQTSDGGYIIVGDTKPYGMSMRSDVYLLKTDADGNLQWKKIFGGNKRKHAHSVQQTSDGGYIVVGWIEDYINGTRKDDDTYLIKTDENGNKVWESIVDALGQHEDDSLPGDAQQTSDGGYIILGRSMDYLLKIDVNGNKVWGKAFGFYSGYFVQQTSDGGYIIVVVGARESGNFLIKMKIDENGNKVWEKTIEKISAPFDVFMVKQTSDEGYVVLGQKEYGYWGETGLVEADIFLMKIDETSTPRPPIEVSSTSSTNPPTLTAEEKSEIVAPPAENTSITEKGWMKMYEGTAVNEVQLTSDGGYVAIGTVEYLFYTQGGLEFAGSKYDIYLLKTDANGNEQWSKTFGIWPGVGRAVSQTSDGGYIAVGDGGFLLKTDADGNMQWNRTYRVCTGRYGEDGNSVRQTSDGGYIIAGETYNCGNDGDVLLVKMDANGNKRWDKAFAFSSSGRYEDRNEDNSAYSVRQTSDGGYIVLGNTISNSNPDDSFPIYIIKTDASGNKMWEKTMTGMGIGGGITSSISQTSDGGYMIERWHSTEATTYERALKEYWVGVFHIKLDADGNKLWANEETLIYNLWDKVSKKEWWSASANFVQQTPDMGYIIGGALYNINQTRDFNAIAGTATSGNRAFIIKI